MEEINEWQQIELETPGWNTVFINENYLQVQGDQSSSISHQDGSSSPLTASSSVSEDESESETETPTPVAAPLDWASEGKKLLKLRLNAMGTEVVRVASKLRNRAIICAGAFWSITYVAGAAAATAVLLSLLYAGIRRRRRRVIGRRSVDGSDYLILTQKDEVSIKTSIYLFIYNIIS